MKASINLLRRVLSVGLMITGVGCVSGCDFDVDYFKKVVNNRPQVVDASEKETSRVFRFYLAAVNAYNSNNVKQAAQEEAVLNGLHNGTLVEPFILPDYKRLEEELIAAQEAGKTYDDVQTSTADILPLLHKVVIVTNELNAYVQAQHSGQSSNIDFLRRAEEYVILRDTFDKQYAPLHDIIRQRYIYEGQRDAGNMRSNGQVNLAYITDIRLIYTNISYQLERSKEVDLAAIYKEIERANSISRDVNSAEAENFKDAQQRLNQAIKTYLESPSRDTLNQVTLAYNNMMEVPLNYRLLDAVDKKSGVQQSPKI